MPPSNDQQGQNMPTNQPPQYSGPWDFLNTPPEPPKKQSFVSQNKKLVIVSAISMILLLIVTVIAVISAPQESGSTQRVDGPTTDVPLTIYEGQDFSMSYADSLNIQIDESVESPAGWFVNLADNVEQPSYDIAVELRDEAPVYANATEALGDLYDFVDVNLAETSNVSLAGNEAEKTSISANNSLGQEIKVFYVSTAVGEQYVTVHGWYPVGNLDIVNSLDSTLGSIQIN